MTARGIYVGLAGAAILISTLSAAAQEGLDLPEIALWDFSGLLAGSLGYKDNVLQSSLVEENSGFFKSEFEASLFRFFDSEALFMVYIFGEDIRYFDAPTVRYEQFFSATTKVSMPIADKHELATELNYLYEHRVYDASETQDNLSRLLVLAHSATLTPYWKYRFDNAWALQLNGIFSRQIYEQDLDDFSEGSGRIDLTRTYGHRSEAQLYYELTHLLYDTREQTDGNGIRIPDTNLIYQQNETGIRWEHYWDQTAYWRTLTQLSCMLNRDNGSGYFDYDRLKARQQLRWKSDNWNIEGNVRAGWYRYLIQQAGTRDLERSYMMVDIRIERILGKNWQLFSSAEQEWNISNDPLDEYDIWMINCGTAFQF